MMIERDDRSYIHYDQMCSCNWKVCYDIQAHQGRVYGLLTWARSNTIQYYYYVVWKECGGGGEEEMKMEEIGIESYVKQWF